MTVIIKRERTGQSPVRSLWKLCVWFYPTHNPHCYTLFLLLGTHRLEYRTLCWSLLHSRRRQSNTPRLDRWAVVQMEREADRFRLTRIPSRCRLYLLRRILHPAYCSLTCFCLDIYLRQSNKRPLAPLLACCLNRQHQRNSFPSSRCNPDKVM